MERALSVLSSRVSHSTDAAQAASLRQSGTMVVGSNFSLCFLLGTCAVSDAQPRNETVTVASRRTEVSYYFSVRSDTSLR